VDQEAERFHAQAAFANVLVPVYSATQRLLAIIQMKGFQPFQADHSAELPHGGSILFFRRQRIAGSEDVASIETKSKSAGLRGQRKYSGQMFEAMPKRTPLPRGGFQENLHLCIGQFSMDLIQRLSHERNSGLFAGIEMSAGVRDQIAGPDL